MSITKSKYKMENYKEAENMVEEISSFYATKLRWVKLFIYIWQEYNLWSNNKFVYKVKKNIIINFSLAYFQ